VLVAGLVVCHWADAGRAELKDLIQNTGDPPSARNQPAHAVVRIGQQADRKPGSPVGPKQAHALAEDPIRRPAGERHMITEQRGVVGHDAAQVSSTTRR
jgi:hypothetical protein